MYKILDKTTLGPAVREYVIEAPDVARVARAGQFIVLRLHERGERIPLTIVECNPEEGSVTLVVQELGKSTQEMGDQFDAGDTVLDFVGPLGKPTEIERYGTVVCIGGGLGIAPLYPIARDLMAAGNEVLGIVGARTRELLFYEDRMRAVCNELWIMTDDGSYGRKGFVTDALKDLLAIRREEIARVWAIGPAIMMKACAEVTRPEAIPTLVSLNSIMIDGTGMCGGCRVEVGGVARFACVDGPEFDGHRVDFDLLMSRQRYYHDQESCAMQEYLKRSAEGDAA